MLNISVAILGTRGIPNRYGGFEQFAEFLSTRLVNLGYRVTVYNPKFHSYSETDFKGVVIVKKFCPEKYFGAFAHIIYDYLCLRDAYKRNVDIVLELGYQSSAISLLLGLRGRPKVITNMDGMEWQRQKWSPLVQKFTRWAEAIAVHKSDALVSDNVGIENYILSEYGKKSAMIPYGANEFTSYDESYLSVDCLQAYSYYLLIARMEPENNIEMILDGYLNSDAAYPFIVIGSYRNKYGRRLYDKYRNTSVRFIDGIYDINRLNNLRCFSRLYFHGHSVGGTNPSLLEAMAANALVIAHKNIYNESVLGQNSTYFSSADDVTLILQEEDILLQRRQVIINNYLSNIRNTYNWDNIVSKYSELFKEVLNEGSYYNSR